MTEVVGVRFKNVGKIYYFDPKGLTLEKDTKVIVETVRGLEMGEVAIPNREVEENPKFMPLSPVIRIADEKDMITIEKNHEKEKKAFDICMEKIKKHKLDMTLVDVEYTFDNSKVIFCFVAEGRVDFRELVKDLAAAFKTRIELRQIGVRDETKLIGGLGMCGRKVCCADFLSEFVPVSVKMAKDQSLSTNPQKISGACGKLICCLNFEQGQYEEAYKKIPSVGYIVETPEGRGTVVESNIFKEIVKVRLDKDPQNIKVFESNVLKTIGKSKVHEEDEEIPKELQD
ncbi:MAG: stage 0 sporulation protein [Clostridiales bacterium]|nr:MAG: stage 0 sporulation protein [Clostridiales bacterium]